MGLSFQYRLRLLINLSDTIYTLILMFFGFDCVKTGEYVEEDFQIYPLRISKNTDTHHIDLYKQH